MMLLIATGNRAFAGELWSWHSVDATFVKTSRLEGILHARFRTSGGFGGFQQGRVGGIARLSVLPAGSIIAGYYYGKEEDSAETWRNLHRVFAGIEVGLYRRRSLVVDTRGLVEHFFVAGSPEFNRYRQRIRVRSQKAVGPYLASEWFFDADGYLSGRYGAGIRWRVRESASLEFGYLYDARRSNIGEARHVIVTQFTADALWR